MHLSDCLQAFFIKTDKSYSNEAKKEKKTVAGSESQFGALLSVSINVKLCLGVALSAAPLCVKPTFSLRLRYIYPISWSLEDICESLLIK